VGHNKLENVSMTQRFGPLTELLRLHLFTFTVNTVHEIGQKTVL
jgi:hypothetical protein